MVSKATLRAGLDGDGVVPAGRNEFQVWTVPSGQGAKLWYSHAVTPMMPKGGSATGERP